MKLEINAIIVDDDPLAIAVVQSYLKKLPYIKVLASCQSAMEAYEVLYQHKVDLIFLDVQMPELSGIEFLKTLDSPPRVIIMSGNRNFAIEGFEMNAIDYLLKPLSFGRFLQAINKYHLQIKGPQEHSSSPSSINPKLPKQEYLFVKENKRVVKIFLKNIIFIESLKDYLKVTTEGKSLLIKHQLNHFEEKLGQENFLRIHKSYLISINQIVAYSASKIQVGDIELPIGRSYKPKVNQVLEKLFFLHS